jgi:glycosyltransferase involved in cell wall biosynthesis
MAERWFKPNAMFTGNSPYIDFFSALFPSYFGYLRLLSPSYARRFYILLKLQKYKNFWFLAKGHNAASEFHRLKLFKGRILNWGYFSRDFSRVVKRTKQYPLRILWVGRFINFKRPTWFLDACRHLIKSGYLFKAKMIGDGPLRTKIKLDYSDIIDGKSVELLDYVISAKISELYNEFDIIVSTSNTSEGWGVVAAEAASHGCLVIASDGIGSVGYALRPGIDCITFRSNSKKDLFDKLETTLKPGCDIIKITTSAKQRIDLEWSAKTAATNFMLFYDSIFQENLKLDISPGMPMSRYNPSPLR